MKRSPSRKKRPLTTKCRRSVSRLPLLASSVRVPTTNLATLPISGLSIGTSGLARRSSRTPPTPRLPSPPGISDLFPHRAGMQSIPRPRRLDHLGQQYILIRNEYAMLTLAYATRAQSILNLGYAAEINIEYAVLRNNTQKYIYLN